MPDLPNPLPHAPGFVRGQTALLLGLALVFPPAPSPAADDPDPGLALYREHCALCHGQNGEGNPDEYEEPLSGDRSEGQLARLIFKTMPADNPGVLSKEQTEQVASYIYNAFYSPTARARNAPARIELSRLTVRQYRQSVADLVGAFRSEPPKWGDGRGLKAEYYTSRRFRRNDRVLERLDPRIGFDFGKESPAPEKIEDPHEFSIRWEGSVQAPETGLYTFTLRTDHAARLWINDLDHPLVDAYVKSGDDTEHSGSVFLVEGRAYPLQVEFSKAKQGVDDSKKRKEEPPVKPAMIKLEWTRPGRVGQVIPSRYLTPERFPETFCVSAPFPPDDRSIGYERGTSISKAWEDATTEGAIETSEYVRKHLDQLAGTKPDAPDHTEKLQDFALQFAERAFRHPLDEDLRDLYVDRQFQTAPDPEAAVKRVVLLVMKSPRFLYPDLGLDSSENDQYATASRIALALWDSLPDKALLDAALDGNLSTPEEIALQAERMRDDLRTKAKLSRFFQHYLGLDRDSEMAKDSQEYPDFDEALVSDLKESLALSLDEMAWSDNPDFRRLFRSDEFYLNGRLAKFYGADLPEDAPFQKVRLNPEARAGVLSHPYLMANFAYASETSPIHRGVFLIRGVLGRVLNPPPQALSPLDASLHPDLTTRERTALQTGSKSCSTCHSMINPLGFSFEHFDAVGRYRDKERGKPIDASGTYETRSGKTVTFHDAPDLADFLCASPEVQDRFIEAVFHHLVKQPIAAYGPDLQSELHQAFASSDFNIRALMVEIVKRTALTASDTQS